MLKCIFLNIAACQDYSFKQPSVHSFMEVIPTSNFQPDILLAGIRFGEPVVALTGLLVTLVCFYAWIRLGRLSTSNDTLRLLRIFFLLMGFSTLIGAVVGHLFLYCLPFVFKSPGWVLGMISMSAFEQAVIVRAKPMLGYGWGRALTWLNIIALTLGLWFVTSTLWFPGVEIHAAFGVLCIIAPLEIILFIKFRNKGSQYLLFGLLFLVVAVLVHILKLSISVWFTFFDIGHLLMGLACWFFMLSTEYHHRHPYAA